MNDQDIAKLAAQLSRTLATKEDLKGLATVEDINRLESEMGRRMDGLDKRMDGLESKMGGLERRMDKLERRIDVLDQKADTILKFAEAVDETTTDHEKRLRRIEAVPIIAHGIKKT